ncbi:hypothetical protein Dda_8619 [Drechslerella dactyloides]|uniref:Cupin type-2 domain-containing protein n=1 Tax=Drechslerella dactyloides TaxID=74499 RepID=A0AAD6IUN1_DREDA|nr:hypothetical protein Dda_8619 [Drechslerella dactyloides]
MSTPLTPTQTITTHNPDGSVATPSTTPIVFSPLNPDSDKPTFQAGMIFSTHTFPVNLDGEDDIRRHAAWTAAPDGFTAKDGVIAVMNRVPPGAEVGVHRTGSIDFGVIVDGEMELILADGTTQLFRRGDVIVQRETAHGWRNPSKDKEAMAFFVALAAKPVQVGEQVLGEDLKNLGV